MPNDRPAFLAAISNRNVMNLKRDCVDFITRKLLRTSAWRDVQARRFPADLRNGRAAEQLMRLATSGQDMTDDQWRQLSPHHDPASHAWSETVIHCARDVGFRTAPETF